MSLRRLAPLFAVALATGAIAAGCGDDGGDGTVISVPSVSVPGDVSVPTEVTIPTDTQAAKDQAYEACINAVNQVPEAQQDAARSACQRLQQ